MPKRIDEQTIYDATVHELLERGYAGATMKRIAERASVSELTLFRKYGNKAELVGAAVVQSVARLHEGAMHHSGDVKTDLTNWVNAFMHSSEYHGHLFMVIMAEMSRYPELQSTLDFPNKILGHMCEMIGQFQASGELDQSADPMHMVGALIGPLIANVMWRQRNPALGMPPLDPIGHVERFLDGHRA